MDETINNLTLQIENREAKYHTLQNENNSIQQTHKKAIKDLKTEYNVLLIVNK